MTAKGFSLGHGLRVSDFLPVDHQQALLVGRVWLPGVNAGPSVVMIEDQQVFDITESMATVSELINLENPSLWLQRLDKKQPLCSVHELLVNSIATTPNNEKASLLAPCDLQSIKACGVTFIESLLERLIEEQAAGDANKAAQIRGSVSQIVGEDIRHIQPGSHQAQQLKNVLLQKNLWSQYLEVGIGPYAEVFTKAQPMSAVGAGAEIGIRSDSSWNNPEPELVLAVNNRGSIVGCCLGNDVNLRDFEGASALLLGQGKDNNASCVLGPFIRLFDQHFSLADVKRVQIDLSISGLDDFSLSASSDVSHISRDIENLVAQVTEHHNYPDGFMLMTGTMYAPIEDRDHAGAGFTHKTGDIVQISSPQLGMLVNRVNYCQAVAPWNYGVGKLMRNLAKRGYLN